VKKGPGRRPQSAKRQWFMELRGRGWRVRAAAREVGVSRSSGANWSPGHKVYRNGVVVGFVAPLDRLAVRQISSRYLSQDERIEIADLRQSGLSVRAAGVADAVDNWDQSTEMARHLATTDKLGAPVYFCDSRSPWQRGTNENTNGLLRDYFPKGVSLANHSPAHLLAVEHELNRRPRQVLQERCPAELFTTLLASKSPSVLRR
jgi:IS30 family transposase